MISLELKVGPFRVVFSIEWPDLQPVETLVPGPGAHSAALELADPAPVGFTPEEKR